MSDERFEEHVAKALANLDDLQEDVAAEVISRWVANHDYNTNLLAERADELQAVKEGGAS